MTSDVGEAPNRFASELFDGLPRRYDKLANILSLGQDWRWRGELVRRVKADLTQSNANRDKLSHMGLTL